ncbi:Predicted pyrophosphatase or phosphodiesterase, AlkP superfamily [Paraburkholderia fungorum]|uniref:Predicted pyrophosphatase or phosphodiesterase, AlkP superfamily n=1 Tax=Paraburkholderia fungorum TaxID=134537 RepID=A0A1H1JHT8_9BURK|nr:alkaline phosphatase family protein [Paraburkholderia fungorum]SDR49524.1 Predicted pyrophosphatase or phosphodiesterase, AlkP superfamily [Paraburkholderia fungorum]
MKPIYSALTAAVLLSTLSIARVASAAATLPSDAPVQHVLLISVDGLHSGDLANFIAAHPDSTLANLSKQGVDYTNAHTVEPADSFPGLLALVTGGTPAVTGVYYDDSYDRALAAPGSDCSRLGTRVRYDESLDKMGADGHDIIDPAKLPRDPQRGCVPVYPHAYLRVNTIFEAVRDAGGYTAWTDKHPTYELVEGPSGQGVEDLFLPEIGANYEGLTNVSSSAITGSLGKTEAYDEMKARAVLNQIDGKTHDGSRSAAVPNVFGLNLQAVNVAQKLYGYRDADGSLTAGVDRAIGHVDQLIGQFVGELDRQHLRDGTLVIVTAKHGNGPIDTARLDKVDERRLQKVIDDAAPGALAQLTTDHGALIWLHDASATQRVSAALKARANALGIADVLSGERLAQRFPAPAQDSRTPDIVVVSRDGVIFTPPKDGKLAEHGGFHNDDTAVALLLANPHLADAGRRVTYPVSTTQVAPTILAALGVPPDALQAVAQEGTPVLPAATWTPLRQLTQDQRGTHPLGK